MVADGAIPPRPGVARVAEEAAHAGWRLAVASTSARQSVIAVLEHAVGCELAATFSVFAGDVVPRKKPAPDVYNLCLRECGLDPDGAVAIEDSRNGLLAADAAGIACLVTLSDYTRDQAMDEARIVVSDLGEPNAEPISILRNQTTANLGGHITLDDLRACLPPMNTEPISASRGRGNADTG